jgi:hypothetical protein
MQESIHARLQTIGALAHLLLSQTLRAIEFREVSIECAKWQMPGFSGDLQHEAVGKPQSSRSLKLS